MQITFAWDLRRRKGGPEALILSCALGSCVSQSSGPELITNAEEGWDSEEGPCETGTWPIVTFRAAGRDPQACPDLIFSGRGRETAEQSSSLDKKASWCLHTAHPRAVGETAVSHEDERGECRRDSLKLRGGRQGP